MELLRFYHWFLGHDVLDEKGREFEDYKSFLCEFVGSVNSCSIDFDMNAFLQKVVRIQSAFRRRMAILHVEKLRRRKMHTLQRRQLAVKESMESKMDLRGSNDAVVREFGQWLGINPRMIDALLLMRMASNMGPSGGSETDEMTQAPSDSSSATGGLVSADDVNYVRRHSGVEKNIRALV